MRGSLTSLASAMDRGAAAEPDLAHRHGLAVGVAEAPPRLLPEDAGADIGGPAQRPVRRPRRTGSESAPGRDSRARHEPEVARDEHPRGRRSIAPSRVRPTVALQGVRPEAPLAAVDLNAAVEGASLVFHGLP